jgi:hypothetical protein
MMNNLGNYGWGLTLASTLALITEYFGFNTYPSLFGILFVGVLFMILDLTRKE